MVGTVSIKNDVMLSWSIMSIVGDCLSDIRRYTNYPRSILSTQKTSANIIPVCIWILVDLRLIKPASKNIAIRIGSR